jgi:hypothetical protein
VWHDSVEVPESGASGARGAARIAEIEDQHGGYSMRFHQIREAIAEAAVLDNRCHILIPIIQQLTCPW